MDYLPIVLLLLILVALSIIQKIGKNKKPVLRAFVNMLIGIGGLLIVNITGFITGVTVPISLFTVGISAGLGVPGITLLLFINLL